MRRAWPWIAGGVVVALCVWLINVGRGTSLTDEAWYLQIVDRVASGDSLYSDVFFGVPPLMVWIDLPVVALLGTDIAVMKAISAAVVAATILTAVWIARRLGVGWVGQLLVGLVSFAYAPPGYGYTPLANLLLLASMAGLLVWRQRVREHGDDARVALICAAAAAGLAVAAKQSIGGLACLALLGCLIFASPRVGSSLRRCLGDAAIASGVIAIAFLVPMVPVLVAGDLSDFVTYVVEKGNYVAGGSYAYQNNFTAIGDILAGSGSAADLFGYGAAILPLLAPLALLGAFVVAPAARQTAFVVAAFTGAAIVGIFPRADLPHIAPAAPACAIAIVWSVRALRAGLPRPVARVVIAGLALGLAATIYYVQLRDPLYYLRAGYDLAETPHFEGGLVDDVAEQEDRETVSALRRVDHGTGRTLLLSPAGAYYYLASGLDPPTRFDYPLDTEFREDDEAELIEAIERGSIRRVCIGGQGVSSFEPLRPEALYSYVRSGMERTARLGPASHTLRGCTLYRRAGGRTGAGPPGTVSGS